jgi:hypothetical protein
MPKLRVVEATRYGCGECGFEEIVERRMPERRKLMAGCGVVVQCTWERVTY